MDFREFFEQATGHAPYPYQARIAEQGLPDVLQAPTGAGKTEAVVLPWLWWAFQATGRPASPTPRRLVIALPLRTLVEQTEARIRSILTNTKLHDEVLVRALMGGRMTRDAMTEWRRRPQQHSIVVGTIDSIVSRALNRGYGQSRGTYPIDFALITNGSHLVIDEVQLCAQATATLRQVNAFQRTWQTAEPVGLTCVSATVLAEALDTVDNPYDAASATTVDLTASDESDPSLAHRLQATKQVGRLPDCGTPKAFAEQIATEHVPGTLTLVMVNTVKQAVETYRALQKATDEASLLVHSRFRGVERAALLHTLETQIAHTGGIVVATQTLEAGVDLDARTLITEVAPWSSLVQRAGRCNRTGNQHGARLLWVSEGAKGPYPPDDLAASDAALATLDGEQVTARDMQRLTVSQTVEDVAILRRSDMLALFETSADQAGRDIDISPFIRSDEPLDVQVAWVDTSRYVGDGKPPAVPGERWRCSVGLTALKDFLRREPRPRVLVFDTFTDAWVTARADRIRPQQVLLIDAASGGYDPVLGFVPASRVSVPIEDDSAGHPELESDGMRAEAASQIGEWVSLSTHLAEARDAADDLCEAIAATTPLPDALRSAVVGAAGLHDLGKAHPLWQRAIAATGDPPPNEGPWAKSAGRGWLTFTDDEGRPRPNFRHELVSALMLKTPAGEQRMAEIGVPTDHFDLCRYLVAAHHGHVRIAPQDPHAEGTSGSLLLGVADGDELPGLDDSTTRADLVGTFGGGPDSWTARSLRLLDLWGPYRLAYAEMLVRMADWQASTQRHEEAS